jgi:hypothetical protein
MPYCSKCGTELAGDEDFCPKCGTSITSSMVETTKRRGRKPISAIAVVLIAVVAAAVVLTAVGTVAFLPIQIVGPVTRRMSVPSMSGINMLNLSLTADIAGVNISFEDLTGELRSPSIILNTSAKAKVSAFGSSEFLERFMPVWHYETEGDALIVIAKQDVGPVFWPRYSSLNVTFDVRIDSSMHSSLDVLVSTGEIVMNTQEKIVIDSLALEVTTGSVETRLAEDVVLKGDVSAVATTGSVRLLWDNAIVTQDVQVDAIATTGSVDVNIKEDDSLQSDITLNAEVITGEVDFTIDIQGDVGAMIISIVAAGGVDVDRRGGFSGSDTALRSSNYPADHNFSINLEATTGGIDIDAKYTHKNMLT